MWILLSTIHKMIFILKIPRPFSKVNVYKKCEFYLLQFKKMRISFKKSPTHFEKLKFTGIMNFTFENSKNPHFIKNPRPFSKVKVFRPCEFWLSKIREMRIFLKICHPFSKATVYRHCEFWLLKILKMPIFSKIPRQFSKLKFYRHCEFWLSKIQKMRNIFKKSPAHFQKLKFTGIVNFDFRKFEKCAFFLKIHHPFSKLKCYRHCEIWLSKILKMRIFIKVKVYRHCEFWLSKIWEMRIF